MLTIGTRGSQLALWQAHWIQAKLEKLGQESRIEIIKTTGDKITDVALSQVGSKGLFTKEIEEALIAGAIDLAVHSLKDMPTDLPPGLTLAAIPEREDPMLHRWMRLARERIAFQGLPARICWLGYGQRARVGARLDELVRTGKVKAPIVIGRDHLDCGSVASPNRETEGMKDGTDAVSDWPLLNALLNASGGATWVSLHHGGGVGMGYSQHAGMVIVADGTDAAARRLARVLVNDAGSGVMRHADAGYELAVQTARAQHLKLPMIAP